MAPALAADRVAALDASARRLHRLVPLTRAQLADYLMSQSNAAAAIDAGQDAVALRAHLVVALAPFAPGDAAVEARFGVRLWTATRV